MMFLGIVLIWILSKLNAPSWCYVLLLVYAIYEFIIGE